MMPGENGRSAQSAKRVGDDCLGRLTPKAMRPKRSPKMASEFPDTFGFVSGMDPAASNVLAGFKEKHRPVLRSLFFQRRNFERQPVLYLLL
jgi:hypothetical protein